MDFLFKIQEQMRKSPLFKRYFKKLYINTYTIESENERRAYRHLSDNDNIQTSKLSVDNTLNKTVRVKITLICIR